MGEYHDVAGKALADGALHGDGVGDAAVEHRHAVEGADRRHERERGRGLAECEQAIAISALGVVFGVTGAAVRGDNLKAHGIVEGRVVVEGQNFVGHAVVEKILVENGLVLPQMFDPDVLIFLEHIDGRLLGAPSLSTQKGHAVPGTGRHADAIGEGDVGIHQVVEHPDGEHHAHTPTFQNQSSRCIHKHKHLWQLLAPLANKCCISVYKSCAKVYYSARNVVTLREE